MTEATLEDSEAQAALVDAKAAGRHAPSAIVCLLAPPGLVSSGPHREFPAPFSTV